MSKDVSDNDWKTKITKTLLRYDENVIHNNIKDRLYTVDKYVSIIFDTQAKRVKKENFWLLMDFLLKFHGLDFYKALTSQIDNGKKNNEFKNSGEESYFRYIFKDESHYSDIKERLKSCILKRACESEFQDFDSSFKTICDEYNHLLKVLNQNETHLLVSIICKIENTLHSIRKKELSEAEVSNYQKEISLLCSEKACDIHADELIKLQNRIESYLKDRVKVQSNVRSNMQVYLSKKLDNEPCFITIDELLKEVEDWNELMTNLISELNQIDSAKIQAVAEFIEDQIEEYGPRFVVKLNDQQEILEKIIKNDLTRQDGLRIIQKCLSEFQCRSYENDTQCLLPSLIELYKKEFNEEYRKENNKHLRAQIYKVFGDLSINLNNQEELDYGSKLRLNCAVIALLEQIYLYEASKAHEIEYLAGKYKIFADKLIEYIGNPKLLYYQEKFNDGEVITAEEDIYIEFKKQVLNIEVASLDQSKNDGKENYYFRLAKSICSLLNAEGGRIYLGIDDDTLQIVGGKTNENHSRQILENMLGSFDPKAELKKHVDFEVIRVERKDNENRFITIISINPEDQKMFKFDNQYFYRGDATTITLSQEEVDKIKITREKLLFQMNETERKKFLDAKFQDYKNSLLTSMIFRNYDEKSQLMVELVKSQKEKFHPKKKNEIDLCKKVKDYLFQDLILPISKQTILQNRNVLHLKEYFEKGDLHCVYQDLKLENKEYIVTDQELEEILTNINRLWGNNGGRIYLGINTNRWTVEGIYLNRKERDNFKSGLCSKIHEKRTIIPNNYINIYFIPLFEQNSEKIIPGIFVIKIVVIKCLNSKIKSQIPPKRNFVDPLVDPKSILDQSNPQGEPRVFIKAHLQKK